VAEAATTRRGAEPAPAARGPAATDPAGQRPRAAATRRPAPGRAPAGPPVLRLTTSPGTAPEGVPPVVAGVIRAPGPGEPLPVTVSGPLGASFGTDLAPVRVHADHRAGAAAEALGVRAFTVGSRVFLGPGQRPTDLPLMAHEVAHVVQQQARPAVQLFAHTPADGLEREARQASTAAARGGTAVVTGRTAAGQVQGFSLVPEFIREGFWDLAEEVAPEVVPILRKGLGTWLREQLGAALQALFDRLMAPVRSVTGFIDTLTSHFTNMVAWMREAAGKIARGDCSSISEAAERIRAVVEGLAAPVIDRVKQLAGTVGKFFRNLWDRVGAPVWEFLKSVGGAIWDKLSRLGAWIWEKTAPFRRALAAAWRWVKRKLGVGEGAEGENGILQWVQRKAGEAWDWLKAKVEPIRKPLLVVAGVLVLLSPAGPIVAIGAGALGLGRGIRWIIDHFRTRGSVVDQRGLLEGTIIPGILGAVGAVTSALGRAAAFVTEKLNAATAGLGELVSAVAGSFLSFAVSAVRWVADQFNRLAGWARDKLTALAGWVKSGLDRLRGFLQPVLDVLRRFGEVVGDIWQIAKLAVSRAWRAIPACIRDPIVDFLVNRILRRIPLLSALLEVPDLWAKVKDTALTVVRQVFRDGNLSGALWTIFKFLLAVLQVPVELVKSIWAKAGAAIELIRDRPLRFLKTFVSALWQGAKQFAGNAPKHLLAGALDWFSGQLREAGIAAPAEWSFFGVLRLVLAVVGVTTEKVFAIVSRKLGPGIVERLRKVGEALSGAWRWVATLLREGPAGLWKEIEQQVGKLREMLVEGLVGWLSDTVVGQALTRLVTALNPVGLAINAAIAFYNALKTAVQYLARLLGIVDRVFDTVGDLARGVFGTAASVFEDALARALPVAIGFFANWLGLGKLGSRVREMIEKVQKKVEQALEWLVDQAIRAGRSILDALGVGRPADRLGPAVLASEPVQLGPEKHVISVRDEAGDLVFTMASVDPDELVTMIKKRIPEILDRYREHFRRLKQIAEFDRLRGKLQEFEGSLARRVKDVRQRGRQAGANRATVVTAGIHELAADFSKITEEWSIPTWYKEASGGEQHDESWQRTGKTLDDAVARAFDRVKEFSGIERGDPEWEVKQRDGGTPVHWEHPSGAEVSIDRAHRPLDTQKPWLGAPPDAPHVGWYAPGTQLKQARTRTHGGHIFIDAHLVTVARK
jgi:phage-related protein